MWNELLTVLSEDVEAVEATGPKLGDDDLARIYEAMVTVRALDERCARLLADGEIGFYVSSAGVEAVSVGAAYALGPEDWVFPSHRDAGLYLLRGGSLRSYMDQLFGNAADLAKGRQMPGHHSLPDGRFVSLSSPNGTQIAQAAGCAMAIKIRGDQRAVLASFGAAAASTADFHAGLDFAGTFSVPAVFLCRYNSSARPGPSGPRPDSAERAASYGVSAERVDGTDVLAVLKAVTSARERALQAPAPTFIEAVTHRDRREGGAADSVGQRDPITRFRSYLEQRGVWDPARDDELAARARERVEGAAAAAAAAESPAQASLFVDVYAELSWILQEEREQLIREGDK